MAIHGWIGRQEFQHPPSFEVLHTIPWLRHRMPFVECECADVTPMLRYIKCGGIAVNFSS